MSAIFFLIGCSVFVALLFLGAFFWANRTGQHEDTHTPAIRILFEDTVSVPSCPPASHSGASKPDEVPSSKLPHQAPVESQETKI